MLLVATVPVCTGFVLILCWYTLRCLYAIDYPLLTWAGLYCYLLFLTGLVVAVLLLPVLYMQKAALPIFRQKKVKLNC